MITRHASNRVCVWFHERTVCECAPYLWKHEILQQLSWYQHVKRWMHRRWPDQWRWKIWITKFKFHAGTLNVTTNVPKKWWS
jgi:hypothetical protein